MKLIERRFLEGFFKSGCGLCGFETTGIFTLTGVILISFFTEIPFLALMVQLAASYPHC